MSFEVDPDRAFLNGIKIALMRHCLMCKDEVKFLRKTVKGIVNDRPDRATHATPLTVRHQLFVENVKSITNGRIDGFLKFSKLMEETGSNYTAHDEIMGYKVRAEKIIENFGVTDMFSLFTKDERYREQRGKGVKFLNDWIGLMDELDSFGEKMMKPMENQVSTICTTSHNSIGGLKEVLLEDHCK